jgi:hypothetical protein
MLNGTENETPDYSDLTVEIVPGTDDDEGMFVMTLTVPAGGDIWTAGTRTEVVDIRVLREAGGLTNDNAVLTAATPVLPAAASAVEIPFRVYPDNSARAAAARRVILDDIAAEPNLVNQGIAIAVDHLTTVGGVATYRITMSRGIGSSIFRDVTLKTEETESNRTVVTAALAAVIPPVEIAYDIYRTLLLSERKQSRLLLKVFLTVIRI